MTPRATYRLQLHAGFTFADAERIVPYLDALGISHIYCSPITTAVRGSQHGYDVVDPTRINPELGGEPAFRSLIAALRKRDMGAIIDIVPNHMGVGSGENPWWQDVLAKGKTSEYAQVFDIDWRKRIVLPVLGEPLEQALAQKSIRVERSGENFCITAYGKHQFPIRASDYSALQRGLPTGGELKRLLDRQHYRLSWWRSANDELNWRRFFSINELAGVRAEDSAVFDLTHSLYFRLWGEGLIDGVRIDHVDGLTDPIGYCRRLRSKFGPVPRDRDSSNDVIIWIEKILGPQEFLSNEWEVEGTSGYDFMAQTSRVLHTNAGEQALQTYWGKISGRSAFFFPEAILARREILSWQFGSQMNYCVEAFMKLAASSPEHAGLTNGMLRRALENLLSVFPVYRTYGTGGSAPEHDSEVRRIADKAARRLTAPGEAHVQNAVLEWLAGTGTGDSALASEAVARFQQLSAPVAAKGVEDTAFYRYGALLSRNDVGFDPGTFSGKIDEFHHQMQDRCERFPTALLATATHDHKRGADVRARLSVLSAWAVPWIEMVKRWESALPKGAEQVDPGDRYMLYQTLFGAWPEGLHVDDRAGLQQFADRVAEWQVKALREAKLRTSWAEPDEQYERVATSFVATLLRSEEEAAAAIRDDLVRFGKLTAAACEAQIIAQTVLHLTAPGIPDIYQGTEFLDLSLVDPDNRLPVDFIARQEAMDSRSSVKMNVVRHLLTLREADPQLFTKGDYQPATVKGLRADRVIAFMRTNAGRKLYVAVTIAIGPDADNADWWGDTEVSFGNFLQPAAQLFRDGSFYVSTAQIDQRSGAGSSFPPLIP